jgi:hypothetical protein
MDDKPIDEALMKKVDKLLSYKAYRLSLTCAHSMPDLLEVGRYEAILAYHTYVEGRGFQHHNWMAMVGYQRMILYIKQQKLREHINYQMLDTTDAPITNRDLANIRYVESIYEDLGPTALEIVNLIFKMPLEIAKTIGEGKPKKTRGRLRQMLLDNGWTAREINGPFKEIKEFLGL